MHPVVVVRPKEEHWEVPQVVLEALDVERHRTGVADLCRPPPVIPQFDPDNLLVMQFLASFTVIAVPAAFWHLYAQALRVEGSGT